MSVPENCDESKKAPHEAGPSALMPRSPWSDRGDLGGLGP